MKRTLLKVFAGLTIVITLCIAYGFLVEPERLVVRHVEITSPHWGGEPLKIGLVSDIHVGGRKVYAPKVARLVARLNALSPDIILLAGDYTSGSAPKEARDKTQVENVEAGYTVLGDLSAPMGVFAVLGNHDFQYGAHHVQDSMEKVGITFVDNRSVVVQDRFCVYGLADEYFGNPTAEGYLSCPKDSDKIGLSHSPDSLFLVPTGSALMLAGHTHGGQLNLPFLGRRLAPIEADLRFAYGQTHIADTPVFVTAGIGMSQITARFRAPPEIVLITLSGID